MKGGFVYILTNWNNKVFYVGVTSNLEKRMSDHRQKLVSGFTKKYNISKLVYFEYFPQVEYAIEAEKKIKGWLRVKKIAPIESLNPEWKDLSQ